MLGGLKQHPIGWLINHGSPPDADTRTPAVVVAMAKDRFLLGSWKTSSLINSAVGMVNEIAVTLLIATTAMAAMTDCPITIVNIPLGACFKAVATRPAPIVSFYLGVLQNECPHL